MCQMSTKIFQKSAKNNNIKNINNDNNNNDNNNNKPSVLKNTGLMFSGEYPYLMGRKSSLV